MVSCSKCNNVFDESFGVCPKCGTVYVKDAAPTPAVQQYMAFQNEGQLREKAAGKKSSKGKLIALMIVLCAVIIGAVLTIILVVAGSKNSEAVREQISLGEKYMSDEDYDEAIIAFEKAIEIDPNNVDAYKKLAEEVLAGRLVLKNWDHSVDQWILRLNCLAQWCPELGLTPITDEDRKAIIQEICHGAFSYKDIKEADVKTAVKSWLSYEQQRILEKQAPERLMLPNGRKPKLTYVSDGLPFVAMRIQELFDVKAMPKLGMGRVPIVLHILAPNMRPVQVTQDLENFWKERLGRQGKNDN